MLEKPVLSISKNYMNKQINYTYKVFNGCLNMSDDGANCSNIKKPTTNLLPEHQFRSK